MSLSASFPTHRAAGAGEAARRRANSSTAAVQRGVASADRAQRPAHALLDEVPLVGGGALDEGQAAEERLSSGALVVERQAGEQRKGRALDELVAAVAPLSTFAQACGVRSNRWKHTVSQMPQLSKSRHQRSICAA